MFDFVRSFKTTLVFLFVLIVVAIGTRTHLKPLAPSTLRDLGFAPLHLRSGEWSRLLTSVFVTAGGMKFYATAAMLALSVGAAEWLFGSKLAFTLFWAAHLITLLAASLLLAIPLHWMNFYRGTVLATASDVGPSAGYFGCLGAVCLALQGRWRHLAAASVLALLCLRLGCSLVAIPAEGHVLSADLAHVIAFAFGVAATCYFLPREWMAFATSSERLDPP